MVQCINDDVPSVVGCSAEELVVVQCLHDNLSVVGCSAEELVVIRWLNDDVARSYECLSLDSGPPTLCLPPSLFSPQR